MQYGGDFRDVLCYICAIGALIVLDGILSSIFAEKINPVGTLKIHKGMQRLIMEKIKTVDLEKYVDQIVQYPYFFYFQYNSHAVILRHCHIL